MGRVAATLTTYIAVCLQCQVFRIKSYWIYQMNNIIISHGNASVDDVQKYMAKYLHKNLKSIYWKFKSSVAVWVRVCFEVAMIQYGYLCTRSRTASLCPNLWRQVVCKFCFNQHNIFCFENWMDGKYCCCCYNQSIHTFYYHYYYCLQRNKLILAAFAQINFNLITCICF